MNHSLLVRVLQRLGRLDAQPGHRAEEAGRVGRSLGREGNGRVDLGFGIWDLGFGDGGLGTGGWGLGNACGLALRSPLSALCPPLSALGFPNSEFRIPNSLDHFRDVHDAEEGPGFVYTRHSYYDRKRQLQFNSFDICLGEEGNHVRETHSQRIYSHRDLLAHIEASPFELLGAYDGFTFDPGSDESDRVHFVLRRPERLSA